MKKYNVEIVETLSRVVEQEAETYEDAVDLVATRYADEEIVLDWHDLEEVEYKRYPSSNLKESFNLIIDYDKEKANVVIGNDYSSGAKYNCKNMEDLKRALNFYLDNYMELEQKNEHNEMES